VSVTSVSRVKGQEEEEEEEEENEEEEEEEALLTECQSEGGRIIK
jgi:hypothetical protein